MRRLPLVPIALAFVIAAAGPAAAQTPPNPQWPALPQPSMTSCGMGATFALGAVFNVTGDLTGPGATDFARVHPSTIGCTGN